MKVRKWHGRPISISTGSTVHYLRVNLPKNKTAMEILKILYTDDDAKMLVAGPFNMVQVDRYTIEDYA